MAFYAVQAIILGLILMLFARRDGKFDTYQLLYAIVWTLAVITIKQQYGLDQANFYSGDQEVQLQMFAKLTTNGPVLSVQEIIGNRYIVLFPVWFLKFFGIEPILATKFLQALCLTTLYKICSRFLVENGIKVRLFHAIFFAGPLFIFISILGLRDLEIALAATYFFVGKSPYLRLFSLVVLVPLRPHLAASLIFGWLLSKFLEKYTFKRIYLFFIVMTIFAFTIGSYGYSLGRSLQYGNQYISPKIFNQDGWWRFLANTIGVQFLSFNDETVKFKFIQLIALRLFFVDSFLIPSCFIFTLLLQKIKYSALRIQVFFSFVFFIGLVSQTEFNSTRQNLPFLSTMGILALVGILKNNKTKNSQ